MSGLDGQAPNGPALDRLEYSPQPLFREDIHNYPPIRSKSGLAGITHFENHVDRFSSRIGGRRQLRMVLIRVSNSSLAAIAPGFTSSMMTPRPCSPIATATGL